MEPPPGSGKTRSSASASAASAAARASAPVFIGSLVSAASSASIPGAGVSTRGAPAASPSKPQLRALAAARLGADLDAQRLSLGDARHVRRQVERAVRPLAEVDERQRQLPLDLAHPADDHRAQRLAGDVGIPGDQQPLGPPVEGDHAARLADARIEVGPPLGHPGYPRPTSSERVS